MDTVGPNVNESREGGLVCVWRAGEFGCVYDPSGWDTKKGGRR